MKPILFLLALVLVVTGAQAQPTTFYLQNVTFTDGGTASGTFTYNPATNTYTNIVIKTTPGTVRTGETYLAVCGANCAPLDAAADHAIFLPVATTNPTGMPSLYMVFSPALTTFGGFDYGLGGVLRALDNEGNCTDSTCLFFVTATDRKITGGTVAPTEPSMLMLMMWG